MCIKKLLFTMLIIYSSIQAQQTPVFKGIPEADKYFIQLNQRFLLNGNKSLDQAASYLSGANSKPDNRFQQDTWLIDNYTFQKWNLYSWENDSSRVYDYNQDNLISELKIRDWVNAQWIDQLRYLYEYDHSLRISTKTFQEYVSNSWIDSLKIIYEYNLQGFLSTQTTYHWNSTDWENYGLMTAIYNNNQPLQDIYQTWNGSTWENSKRVVYEYSQNSIIITNDVWLYETWINLLRIVINYSTNGFLTEFKIQIWIPFIGWLNLSRILYIYDNNYNITVALNQVWDTDISDWIDYSRITTAYNSENLPETALTELWTSGNNWTNDFLESFVYDEFLNQTEVIGQDWNGTGWINIQRELFEYSEPTAVKENIPDAGEYKLIGNYPNPFNPATTIQFYIPELSKVTLKIYNSIGEEVDKLLSKELTTGSYEIKWNAEGLPSGVYFYRLQAGEFVETKKMILMK